MFMVLRVLFTKAVGILCVATLVLFLSQPTLGALVLLYDGSGLPANQAWLGFAGLGGISQQTSVAGGVRLESDLPVSAGYSNYLFPNLLKNAAFPTLNPNLGFELAFSLAVTSENHTSNDRAGFSAIILGSDRKGIELGFWSNEIWAQSSTPLFQHAEGISIDTTVRRDYRIQILNSSYTLFDGSNTLLAGSVRDYTAFNSFPYTQSNFLFLGDNTTRGAADITLGKVTLQSDLAAVPEPTSLALLSCALLLLRIAFRNTAAASLSPARGGSIHVRIEPPDFQKGCTANLTLHNPNVAIHDRVAVTL